MEAIEHRDSRPAGTAHQFLLSSYVELRRVAEAILRHQQPGETFQATGLVHEAAVRLMRSRNYSFNDRVHFFRAMVREMRRILVDAARKRKSRRGHLTEMRYQLRDMTDASYDPLEILALDEALVELERTDPDGAQIAELRCIGGMTHTEIASILSVSLRTVERKWALARSRLSLAMRTGLS